MGNTRRTVWPILFCAGAFPLRAEDIVALLREYQPDVALFLSDPKSARLELA